MTTQRKNLLASWLRTRTHLDSAVAQLPEFAGQSEEAASVRRYCNWLDHNELELALDELETLGEMNCPERSFWESLLRAATEMKLDEHAIRYKERLNR